MKSVSTELATHLASETLSVAHCLRLVRVDTTVMGFTDHDQNITYGGVVYYASTAHNLSALSASATMAVDKVDMESILDSSAITLADLKAGKYDYAKWYLFLVNWRDLTQGKMDLACGWLGKTEIGKIRFYCEASTLFQALDQTLCELLSPGCRANLGDSRCKINIWIYTMVGTVTTGASYQVFTASGQAEADGIFNQGLLTWTGGANSGRTMEVKSYLSKTFTLKGKMPSIISAGDTYDVTYGCDKSKAMCIATFNNIINFRGEPYLPGTDRMIQYAPGQPRPTE